jgi:hypothetical protein
VGEDVDALFRPIKRHAHNDDLQDRAAMAGGDSFTGIPGIPNRTCDAGIDGGDRRPHGTLQKLLIQVWL